MLTFTEVTSISRNAIVDTRYEGKRNLAW